MQTSFQCGVRCASHAAPDRLGGETLERSLDGRDNARVAVEHGHERRHRPEVLQVATASEPYRYVPDGSEGDDGSAPPRARGIYTLTGCRGRNAAHVLQSSRVTSRGGRGEIMKRHVVAGLSILAVIAGVGLKLSSQAEASMGLQDISLNPDSEHSAAGASNSLAGIRIRLSPNDDALSGIRIRLSPNDDALSGIRIRLSPNVYALSGIRIRLSPNDDALSGIRIRLSPNDDALSGIRIRLSPNDDALSGIRIRLSPNDVGNDTTASADPVPQVHLAE